MAFGLVPQQVVTDLQEVGNWKSRAVAIDALQKALQNVPCRGALLQGLGPLVNFLLLLACDHNFKIAVSSLQIIGELVGRVGSCMAPYLSVVVPVLVEKFSDSKELVRGAAMKVLRQLMLSVGPSSVVPLVLASAHHSHWRVREEVVNVCILAVLMFPSQHLDLQALCQAVLRAMDDPKERVRIIALEAMAVIGSTCGPSDFRSLLDDLQASQANIMLIDERMMNSNLPSMGTEGRVQHIVESPVPAESTNLINKPTGLEEIIHRTSGTNSPANFPWEMAPVPIHNQVGVEITPPHSPQPQSPSFHTSLEDRKVLMEAAGELLPCHTSVLRHPMEPHDAAPMSKSTSSAPVQPSPIRDAPQTHPGSPGSTNAEPLVATDEALRGEQAASPGSKPSLLKWTLGCQIPPGRSVSLLPIANGVGTGNDRFGDWKMGSPTKAPSPRALSAANASIGSLEGLAVSLGLMRVPGSKGSDPSANAADSSDHRASIGNTLPFVWAPGAHIGPLTRGVGSGAWDHSSEAPMGSINLTQEQLGDDGVDLPQSRSFSHTDEEAVRIPGGPVPLWLTTPDTPQTPSRIEGRSETWSPSRGEKLANLKRRQQEKRANSSQMSTRPFDPGTECHPSEPLPSSLLEDHHHCGEELPDNHLSQSAFQAGVKGPASPDGTENPQEGSQHTSPTRGVRRMRLDTPSRRRRSSTDLLTCPVTPSALPSVPSDPNMALGRWPTTSPSSLSGLLSPATTPGTPCSVGSIQRGLSGTAKIEELSFADLTPVSNPEGALRQVIHKLVSCNNADRKELDWMGQTDALNTCRRVVKHNIECLRGSILHEVVVAAGPALEALRSSTAKTAMALFQEMFMVLGKWMDKELDDLVPPLVKKAGEVSNAGRENFLTSEADRTLSEMVHRVSECRAVTALLACSTHKGPYVRARVAFHLDELLEETKAHPALLSNSSVMEKLFKTAAIFLEEGSLETRTYGKRIIWQVKQIMGTKGDFDRLVGLLRPEALQKKVLEVVEGANGPPLPPGSRQTGGGAGGLRSGSRSAGGTQWPSSPSANREGGVPSSHVDPTFSTRVSSPSSSGGGGAGINSVSGSRMQSARRTPPEGNPSSARRTPPEGNPLCSPSIGRQCDDLDGRRKRPMVGTPSTLSPEAQTLIDHTLQQLSSKDWKLRGEALKALEGQVRELPSASDLVLMQVLDALTARTSDGNSKVVVQTLELLSLAIPIVGDRIFVGLSTLVPALTGNLSSTNDKIRSGAQQLLDVMVASMDPTLLVQNFSHCVVNCNQKGKASLVEKLQGIVPMVWPTKPNLVVKHVVPAALALLNDNRGESRLSGGQLLNCLAQYMGTSLLNHCSNLSMPLQQKVKDIVQGARPPRYTDRSSGLASVVD